MNIGLGIGIPFNRSQIWLSLFSPSSLFATGEQGVWYDPSDLTTLYQDAAGTTPVTAVEQPVGLMLDKSKGLVLGPELVTNGTFASNLSGWTQSTPNYWTWVNGRAYHVNSTNYNEISQTLTTFSKPVQIEFDYECLTASTTAQWFYINAAGVVKSYASDGIPRLAAGVGKMRYVALDGIQKIGFSRYSQAEFYIDNISVRELPGNHAFQTTSTKRPVLSARVNGLLSTENLTGAGGVSGSATRTANTLTVTSSMGDGYYQTSPFIGSVPVNVPITVSAELSGAGTIRLAALNGSGNPIDTKIVTLTATPTRYTVTTTNTSTGTNCGISIGSNGAATTVTVSKLDYRVSNTGVNLPAYQKVNTATDYDTQGFPTYLKFDSIDDALQTNNIDFTATDKMTVFAGVRKLSDAAAGAAAELSVNWALNSGAFGMFSPGSTVLNGFAFRSNGTATSLVDVQPYASPTTNVLTGIGDISGDQAILRVNGIQAAISTSDQGTGNYGNYPLYIGARAGTSLFFNGLLYQLIIAGGSVINIAEEDLDLVLNEAGDSITAETTVPIGISTIEACERFVNRKTLAY